MGEEELDLPAGRMRAVHFAQMAAPGQPQLDVWLAPAQAWLPVQLQTRQGRAITLHQLAHLP
jgi:uncharacterized ferritin-like protein (DUF455 family)